MRLHAKIDVQSPLKRRKKISLSKMNQVYAIFQYEKLTLLCFLYRHLGHGKKDLKMGWDISLNVVSRRASTTTSC
ncbi:hypothetical protein Gogos_001234 [Gossypium gossypioides]|uniref:Zinc knuckle CX2CX4HX4C domain-containing protein n=1 Tax=Gossypium gossypioides TaxID=34282 RepID=A0A7J9CVW7_GOSGO|nr:hypothetical protein [Gossypium gossypioides]